MQNRSGDKLGRRYGFGIIGNIIYKNLEILENTMYRKDYETEPCGEKTDMIKKDKIGWSQYKEQEKELLMKWIDIQDSLVSWKQNKKYIEELCQKFTGR